MPLPLFRLWMLRHFECSVLKPIAGVTVTVVNWGSRQFYTGWNVMVHGDAREGKWRGNWRMEWAASTLHTTSERGVSRITTADTHTSAASSRLNWRPRRFKWTRPFRPKGEIRFLRVCHHISTGLYELHETHSCLTDYVKILCTSFFFLPSPMNTNPGHQFIMRTFLFYHGS